MSALALDSHYKGSKTASIELAKLPAGAYFAVYITNNKVQTLQFIKE